MNRAKRVMLLITGIAGIAIGAFLAVYGAYIAVLGGSVAAELGVPGAAGMVVVMGIIEAVFGILFIVFGSLLCPNPVKDGVIRTQTGKIVALLIISGILLVLSFVLVPIIFNYIFTVIMIGLSIATLCIKAQAGEPAKVEQVVVDQPADEQK